MQRPNRLREVLYNVALEFIVVFLAASYSVILYYWIAFRVHVLSTFYFWGAMVIAALIVLVSISSRHYTKIQSHRKRWYVTAGIGAVGLAFSLLFLPLLFLFKFADQYLRGAFFFQLIAVTIVIVGVRTLTRNNCRQE